MNKLETPTEPPVSMNSGSASMNQSVYRSVIQWFCEAVSVVMKQIKRIFSGDAIYPA